MERLDDGTANVRLANGVREEDRDGQRIYVYDEAVFTLGADRGETEEDIQADFESWWEYGTQDEEPAPTLEERVAMLEDYIIAGGDI